MQLTDRTTVGGNYQEPNEKNAYGMTPMEVAIQAGNMDLIKQIASDKGYDPSQSRCAMFLEVHKGSASYESSPAKMQELKNMVEVVSNPGYGEMGVIQSVTHASEHGYAMKPAKDWKEAFARNQFAKRLESDPEFAAGFSASFQEQFKQGMEQAQLMEQVTQRVAQVNLGCLQKFRTEPPAPDKPSFKM